MTKLETAFEENLYNHLVKRNFEKVLQIIKNPENDNEIQGNIWNIINLICLTVKENNILKSEDDVAICSKTLVLLVDQGNAKEVLVALLEQADTFKEHAFFSVLLEPLRKALKKNPAKRGKSLLWVLSALNAHIESIPAPQDLDLQEDEKMLLDADSAVIDSTYVLSNYLSFIEYFVDEVSFHKLKYKTDFCDKVSYQQEILIRYILKLLYKPFLFLDLHQTSNSRPKSTVRALCENYISCLFKVCKNVFNLYKFEAPIQEDIENIETKFDEDDSVPLLAFANLSYLIFVENIALNFQPFVYSHLYIFCFNLKYIIALLSRKENLILFKVLHLSNKLLNNLDDFQLNYDFIELEMFTDFPMRLLDVAKHSQFKTHRQVAVDVFLLYICKCNWKGRFHLIMQVLSVVKHSGAEGLVINLYKKYVHKALNGTVDAEYFLGENFITFIKQTFVLTAGVETDILENSDKIITSLNFLRYLFLRDKKENNATKIWNYVENISQDFLDPLSTGLNLSRAHYKEALKNVELESKNKDHLNTTVSVNNEILPNVPLNFQKVVFDKALITFDMIESILSRVKEVISV